MSTLNCWEFKNFPEGTFKKCSAYPDKGLDCWKVTGTKCDMGRFELASIEEKVEFCRKCAYYMKHSHKFQAPLNMESD